MHQGVGVFRSVSKAQILLSENNASASASNDSSIQPVTHSGTTIGSGSILQCK